MAWDDRIGLELARRGVLRTYTPNGGAARTILTLIEFNPERASGEVKTELELPTRITVRNNATTGIDVATFDRGKDTIQVEKRPGATPVTRHFGQTIFQDAQSLVVEVL